MGRLFVLASKSHGLLLAMTCVIAIVSPAPAREPLSAVELRELAARHLRPHDRYRPGDLICRSDAEPIFNELLERGIEPTHDREGMYAAFLPENAYLVTLLRGPQGQVFMRRVRELPGAYDLLDRLSWFPSGRETLYRLVHSQDGATQFQAMLAPAGHSKTEAAFASEPRARNLFLPTGRIYTEHGLLRQLEALHARPAS
jgi:hypothetical protein